MKISKLLNWLLNFCVFYNDTPSGGGSDDSDHTSGDSVVGTGNDERLRILDAINDANDELRADELQHVNDDGTTVPFASDKSTDAGTDDAGTDDIAQINDEPVTPVKIKVNGQEIELTPELIEKAQKVASADKYLEEAALAKKAAAPTKQEKIPTDVTPPARDAEAERLEEERALVRAIQMGTEEEAIGALRKIRTGSTGITAREVAAITDERLNFQSALNWFQTEYKDLVDDPVLNDMVLNKDDELVREGDKRPYRERYDAIGKEVRAWRDGMVKKYAPPPAQNSVETKLERKANAPAVPKAASVKAKPANDDEGQEESVQDVIANMAKSRGGPQWTRA